MNALPLAPNTIEAVKDVCTCLSAMASVAKCALENRPQIDCMEIREYGLKYDRLIKSVRRILGQCWLIPMVVSYHAFNTD